MQYLLTRLEAGKRRRRPAVLMRPSVVMGVSLAKTAVKRLLGAALPKTRN
jgi:hypothetical protein